MQRFCVSVIVYFCLRICSTVAAPQSAGFDVQLRNDDGSWKQLYEIVMRGDESAIREILLHTSDVNAGDESGNTALHFAALNGHDKIANLLIRNGGDVNAANQFGETILHNAASSGREVILDLLIQNGVNINSVNKNGDTALHFAANNGHAKIISSLVRNGANYNAISKNGNTPLHVALNNDKSESVEALLENNADRNIKNNKDKTANDLVNEKRHRFQEVQNIIASFETPTAQRACNIYERLPENKIGGGSPVGKGEFPWMVALGYLNEQYTISFDCGGTIISNYFILTAAHCTTIQRRPVVVRIGSTSLMNDGRDLRPKDRYVETIIRHPDYSPLTKVHDIALIRVTEQMEFSITVRPACLYTDLNDVDKDTKLVISGWGLRPQSNELLQATINTIPLSECNSIVLELNKTPDFEVLRNGLSAGQYCAHDPTGITDNCPGDSGGPLQLYPPDSGVVKIVGVVSFGISCGSPWPGIYTRVAYYLDWIESYVWPNAVNSRF